MNDFFKYLDHLVIKPRHKWYPFIGVYYLTYACDFRCPYCSDGSGKPYYKLPQQHPSAQTVKHIVQRMRKSLDHLVITGGEPLQHPEFGEVMCSVSQCRFKTVVLTTNGYAVDRHLEVIAKAVDTLVFSIDTLDAEKADRWHGVVKGSHEKTLDNLARSKDYPGHKYKILISSVVTPENISDLYGVYEMAQRNGFAFAAAPQLVGVYPHTSLQDNKEYQNFFDFLKKEKLHGRSVFGTPLYLGYMRDLRSFPCRPFTMLVVGPNGAVHYPCLELGHEVGNLLEEKTLHQFRAEGERRFGPQPKCGNRCQSACALSFGLLFKHILSVLPEIWLTIISQINSYGIAKGKKQ